jgi:hypothetical protein
MTAQKTTMPRNGSSRAGLDQDRLQRRHHGFIQQLISQQEKNEQ